MFWPCLRLRQAVQPSATQKSTLWANYQYNTWLWVGSKQEGGRGITSLLVSTVYAMTCDTAGGRKTERKLHENRLSSVHQVKLTPSDAPSFTPKVRGRHFVFGCRERERERDVAYYERVSQTWLFASDRKCFPGYFFFFWERKFISRAQALELAFSWF